MQPGCCWIPQCSWLCCHHVHHLRRHRLRSSASRAPCPAEPPSSQITCTQQQFIHSFLLLLLRFLSALFFLFFFFLSLIVCTFFVLLFFLYFIAFAHLLYFNSLLYTFSFVRRRRRLFFFFHSTHFVPFCYSTLQFESRQNSRMLRNCQQDFCTTIKQLLFVIIFWIIIMFALSFVECDSLDEGEGEGGSWSTGTGYKHALKNALCVCPLRLFRLRFSHISLDFFSRRMTWKILSIYSIMLETAALFNSLSLHFSNYTHKHTHAHKMYHPHNEAIPSDFIKIFKTTSG